MDNRSSSVQNSKILMFGKNGLISYRLAELFGSGIVALGSDQVDFLKDEQITQALEKYKPTVIINAAAYTKVDLAEDETTQANQINGYALKIIGDWAKAHQAHVIHFSTDYVFNGENSQGYKEDDATDPVNAYGQSKLLGEKLLRESGAQNSIFRISWIYDDRGTNFFMTMKRLMSEREEISVVNDQHGMPTPAKWVAQNIFDLVTQGKLKVGLFHMVPPGLMTWYDFAEKIKADHGYKTKINPIPSSQYKTKAKRPKWSKLISTRYVVSTPFISICILSYNRPETLDRLFKTIDLNLSPEQMEVVVCEDHSPRSAEIRKVTEDYAARVSFKVTFHSNEKNLGYDGNFNQLTRLARGEWIVYMGDDDEFVPGAFDQVQSFLKQHPELGYVMKSHYLIHDNGDKEVFKYFKETTFFSPGENTYISLFRRSVFIAGFMIKRDLAVKYLTDRFDGTMLMQIYLLAEVVLKHPSAYLDIPFTQQYYSHDHNKKDVMFDREKKQFMARKPTLDISLKFVNSFFKITEDIDRNHCLKATPKIKKDMSKYFYPSLAVHRNSGAIIFLKYVKELNKLGFNASVYFYIYVILLLFLGKKTCDWGIFKIKQILGRTPQL